MSDPVLPAHMPEEGGISVAFDDDGLVPVVAQSVDDGAVLMLAYANEDAIERTRKTGNAHYYSRSRDAIWQKGESSGHRQAVEDIRIDCDGDAILYRVSQVGGACHTGHRSCFYRTISGEQVGERVFDPDDVYD